MRGRVLKATTPSGDRVARGHRRGGERSAARRRQAARWPGRPGPDHADAPELKRPRRLGAGEIAGIGGSANGSDPLARINQKSHRATPPVCRGPSAGSPPRGTVKSDGRMWRTVCATQRKAFRFMVECSASRAAVVPEAMIGRTVVVSRFTVGQRGVFRAAGHRWSEGGIPGMPPGIPDDPPVGILFGEFSP